MIVDFNSKGMIEAYNAEGKIICRVAPQKYVNTQYILGAKPRKELCKQFFNDHGLTPTYVRKRINAFMKQRVFDSAPNCNKLLFSGAKRGVGTTWDRFEYEEIAEQCKQDGIENVIPAVVNFGMTPQELKKELGKSMWKKICNNSYTKNRIIYHSTKNLKNVCFEDFVEVPFTLAKSGYTYLHKDIWKYMKNSGLPMKAFVKGKMYGYPAIATEQQQEAKKIVDIYIDTFRMSQRLNQPFNPEWSVRRMHEEHERLMQMQRDILRKQEAASNSVRFDEFQKLPVVEHNGVAATPLLTRAEVIAEGENMRHCVGGYAMLCAQGAYVVYSLCKDGQRTTLGIIRYKTTHEKANHAFNYILNQHYGRFNEQVNDSDFIETAKKVIQTLHKANKEIK